MSGGNLNVKIQFNNSDNNYSNLKFPKISNGFTPKVEVTPKEENIYYDEIIYYDGGDVYGYGDS